tara:strand:+ start:1889 stop:3295 length:1407 start_codon:yes stop_codon:yes gene_type:complete
MNKSLFILFVFFGCSKTIQTENIVPNLDMPSKEFVEFKGDYKMDDFWPAKQDSTLFYLLEKFNLDNYNLSLLDIQADIGSLNYKLSKADRWPSIYVSGSQSRVRQNLATFGLPDNFLDAIEQEGSSDSSPETISLELKTQWEIDLWGRLKNKDKSKYYSFQSNIQDIEFAKKSMRANFLKLFFNAANLNNQVDILSDNLKNLKLIKEITEKRYLKGISNNDEIHLSSANYHLFETKFLSVQSQYNDIVRNIELLNGNYPKNNVDVNYNFLDSLPKIISAIPSNLIERRPDVISVKQKILSSDAMLKSNKKNLLPAFSFSGSIGQSSTDLKKILDEEFMVWGMGISVFQPLFQGKKIRNIIKLNKYQIESLRQEYISVVYNSFYEVEKYIERDRYLEEIYHKITISQNEMLKAVEHAVRSYELGLVDLVYLLNYQQQYFDICLEVSQVLTNKYTNRVDLILSLGGKFEY